uniref:Uncharacterized protein n=1 Tax=Oryza nivara TaxID=4536 RepID=A0A0E0FNA5_ORYNI
MDFPGAGALSAGQRRHRSQSDSSVTGVSASPDGSAKGAAEVGLRRLLVIGGSSGCRSNAAQPGFSLGQNWRGGRRVVERRGPEPALRGGGSMKLAARGASVRCGGSYALPFVHEVVLSWWTAIFSQGVHRAGSGYAFGCRLAEFGHA